jgi:glutamyl-Q tRNA(Asp) synthetase
MKSRKNRLAAPDQFLADTVITQPACRGRFAPSPTGPLHLGSVVAALASFLDARKAGGTWLVRMEDLDPPREVAGAASAILHTLERLGLCWDETVVYQSHRHEAYREALDKLEKNGLLYQCRCSRLQLAQQAIYPGTCRKRLPNPEQDSAIRLLAPATTFAFTDRLQGYCQQQLAAEVGDFIVRRKDRCFAYQLAVVVDDGWQAITDVVRGCDLLDSTPRQLYLQQQLGLPEPRYMHIPVIINSEGQKLGKQQFASPIDAAHASAVLWTSLNHLLQAPDPQLQQEHPSIILEWAVQHWQPEKLKGSRQIREQL